jgi:hypothetical protein
MSGCGGICHDWLWVTHIHAFYSFCGVLCWVMGSVTTRICCESRSVSTQSHVTWTSFTLDYVGLMFRPLPLHPTVGVGCLRHLSLLLSHVPLPNASVSVSLTIFHAFVCHCCFLEPEVFVSLCCSLDLSARVSMAQCLCFCHACFCHFCTFMLLGLGRYGRHLCRHGVFFCASGRLERRVAPRGVNRRQRLLGEAICVWCHVSRLWVVGVVGRAMSREAAVGVCGVVRT